jgi:hypothetical protein
MTGDEGSLGAQKQKGYNSLRFGNHEKKRTSATVSVSLGLRSSLSIQAFEGSRFVRGGRNGISIDSGLEVVEKQSVCGTIFESEFIQLTKKLKLTIASS